ncbi:apolipoprotein N-acyltransferase [Kineococcus radiotolerans]|uniref:Apolipoprotein N-acyltransferase n=1 Tax=Kineococcus radiotolerans (strain ATCC BAA-149 / DSM 14245 / SRS30216) TaxID=266940 RepID=A6W987_KINRD|nr:apolipoprotein N-acyltransferase [Kineococcus radiotolerans SRS30216 = ATCC BAA-149]
MADGARGGTTGARARCSSAASPASRATPGPRRRRSAYPRLVRPRPAEPAPAALPVGLLLAVLGGVATWAAFPGAASAAGWWPTAIVGAALLSLATHGVRARRGLLAGFLFGTAFMFPHLEWSGTYVGLLPWSALTVVCALFYAVLGACLPRLQRARGGLAPLAVAAGWVALEAARARVPFEGFPWGRLAFSQADAPTLGLAALGGSPAVTFGVALAGACLAGAVLALLRLPAPPGAARGVPRVRPAVVSLLVAVLVTAAGALVPRPTGAEDGTTRIAAVQGNVPQAGLEFNAERRAVLDNHAAATRALAEQVAAGTAPQPDLVLWPENSSDIDPYENADARRVIESTATAIGVPVLVGAVLDGPGRYVSNTGLVVTPQEGLSGAREDDSRHYVKQRPAPFGEYMPHRSFFRRFSDKVDLVPRDFVHGDHVGLLRANGVRIGDVICFEVAFDDTVRDSVRAGAQFLVVQTNNATFGYSDEAVQQLAMSRLRAVESGRAVVQISTVGVSAIIGPDGTAHDETTLFTRDVLQGDVALRSTETVATRVGAVPEQVLTGLALLLLLTARRGQRPDRRGGRGGGRRTVPSAPAGDPVPA